MVKYSGKVRWFNNKKGYGFIAPASAECPSQEDIFVHQTNIVSDGAYRTLAEEAEVEFELEKDESDKWKAVNVTAPGGGILQPPPKRNRKPRVGRGASNSKPQNGKSNGTKEPRFYDNYSDETRAKIQAKGFDLSSKTTLDVAMKDFRFKIGQGGYAGLVVASGTIAEGNYTSSDSGEVNFTWERALSFKDGSWVSTETGALPSKLSLANDDVKPVGVEETLEGLWGSDKTDPKEAFEANGFKMRRVVLTRAPNSRGRGGKKSDQSK